MKSKTMAESADSSREKLIMSAENLFAERGFHAVSVREIAKDAQVNAALVGYYFRGKEGLLAEVYTRHSERLKDERAKLLAGFRAGGRSATLEQILEAFIRPSFQPAQGSEEGRKFSRLGAILSAENSSLLEPLIAKTFAGKHRPFIEALCACLPELTREDVFWRYHFLLGTMYYTAVGPNRIRKLSKGTCDPSKSYPTSDQLITFAVAAFRAPKLELPPPLLGETESQQAAVKHNKRSARENKEADKAGQQSTKRASRQGKKPAAN